MTTSLARACPVRESTKPEELFFARSIQDFWLDMQVLSTERSAHDEGVLLLAREGAKKNSPDPAIHLVALKRLRRYAASLPPVMVSLDCHGHRRLDGGARMVVWILAA